MSWMEIAFLVIYLCSMAYALSASWKGAQIYVRLTILFYYLSLLIMYPFIKKDIIDEVFINFNLFGKWFAIVWLGLIPLLLFAWLSRKTVITKTSDKVASVLCCIFMVLSAIGLRFMVS